MAATFRLPQTFNHALAQEALGLLPGGVNSASRVHTGLLEMGGDPSLYLSSGLGSKVVDADGNSYIDYHCCAGSAIFGHRPAFVQTAIGAQLANGVCFSASHPLEVEVGRLIKI